MQPSQLLSSSLLTVILIVCSATPSLAQVGRDTMDYTSQNLNSGNELLDGNIFVQPLDTCFSEYDYESYELSVTLNEVYKDFSEKRYFTLVKISNSQGQEIRTEIDNYTVKSGQVTIKGLKGSNFYKFELQHSSRNYQARSVIQGSVELYCRMSEGRSEILNLIENYFTSFSDLDLQTRGLSSPSDNNGAGPSDDDKEAEGGVGPGAQGPRTSDNEHDPVPRLPQNGQQAPGDETAGGEVSTPVEGPDDAVMTYYLSPAHQALRQNLADFMPSTPLNLLEPVAVKNYLTDDGDRVTSVFVGQETLGSLNVSQSLPGATFNVPASGSLMSPATGTVVTQLYRHDPRYGRNTVEVSVSQIGSYQTQVTIYDVTNTGEAPVEGSGFTPLNVDDPGVYHVSTRVEYNPSGDPSGELLNHNVTTVFTGRSATTTDVETFNPYGGLVAGNTYRFDELNLTFTGNSVCRHANSSRSLDRLINLGNMDPSQQAIARYRDDIRPYAMAMFETERLLDVKIVCGNNLPSPFSLTNPENIRPGNIYRYRGTNVKFDGVKVCLFHQTTLNTPNLIITDDYNPSKIHLTHFREQLIPLFDTMWKLPAEDRKCN